MANKITLTIIVSIILTVIVISLVNVGTSIIIEEPRYDDFCDELYPKIISEDITEAERITINEQSIQCGEDYRDAIKPYKQYRYYIFAGIGFLLLLVGLFAKENIIQLTGLAAGGIIVAEGIVINIQNKIIVFFSLLAILVIFGVTAWQVINKKH